MEDKQPEEEIKDKHIPVRYTSRMLSPDDKESFTFQDIKRSGGF